MPRTSEASLHPSVKDIHKRAAELGGASHVLKMNSRKGKDPRNMTEKQKKNWRAQVATEKAREKRRYYERLLEDALVLTNDKITNLKLEVEHIRDEINVMRSMSAQLQLDELLNLDTFNLSEGAIVGLYDV